MWRRIMGKAVRGDGGKSRVIVLDIPTARLDVLADLFTTRSTLQSEQQMNLARGLRHGACVIYATTQALLRHRIGYRLQRGWRAYVELDRPTSMQPQLFDEALRQHNVFFALQPPAAAGMRIVGVAEEAVSQRDLRARLRPLHCLHVSLCAVGSFVDPLPSRIIGEAKMLASTVSMAPFEVVFDRVASFGGGALVLTGGEGVAGVMKFQHALNLALSKAGVGVRQSKPITPHVTMAHGNRTRGFGIEPISWTVREFVLVDSLVGQSKHIVLGRWPLANPVPASLCAFDKRAARYGEPAVADSSAAGVGREGANGVAKQRTPQLEFEWIERGANAQRPTLERAPRKNAPAAGPMASRSEGAFRARISRMG